jgi:hypothetical protein
MEKAPLHLLKIPKQTAGKSGTDMDTTSTSFLNFDHPY